MTTHVIGDSIHLNRSGDTAVTFSFKPMSTVRIDEQDPFSKIQLHRLIIPTNALDDSAYMVSVAVPGEKDAIIGHIVRKGVEYHSTGIDINKDYEFIPTESNVLGVRYLSTAPIDVTIRPSQKLSPVTFDSLVIPMDCTITSSGSKLFSIDLNVLLPISSYSMRFFRHTRGRSTHVANPNMYQVGTTLYILESSSTDDFFISGLESVWSRYDVR